MIYAGIGSRDTPQSVIARMQKWGGLLASRCGFTLRSGHARGADEAFELGCMSARGSKEIFTADMASGRQDWFNMAARFHPAWHRCTGYAALLHARNSPIVLGDKLDTPVNFVLCWTRDGKTTGGTGQAMRIANAYAIPIFNFYHRDCEDSLHDWLSKMVHYHA